MRLLLQKTILFLLPPFIILISVNYFGDPAKLFDDNYEKEIASLICQNKYVTNISNYDERILQKEIIQCVNKNPNVLVIGSSRTTTLNKYLLKDSSVLNLSVSGSTIEDLIAIYQLFKISGKKNKKNHLRN